MSGEKKNNSYVVEDKAASYQMTPGDIGKVLVATAAITFTLPLVADVWNGWNITCYDGADTAMTIASEADKMITFNDVDSDAVAFDQTGLMIGTAARLVYDSALTKWLVFCMGGETGTMTVTT